MTTASPALFPARSRLSIPSAGRPLSTVTEERAHFVRRAVGEVERALGEVELRSEFQAVFGARWIEGELVESGEPLTHRAAWAIVGMWIVGRLLGRLSSGATLADAECWFTADRPTLATLIPEATGHAAIELLNRACLDEDFADLLPYILEPHGPGSRASVMRDPTTSVARNAKRANGVFYTPADVAEFMAGRVLDGFDGDLLTSRCLDPACGTGVFLRAMLRLVSERRDLAPSERLAYATRCLFGFDVSPLAVDAACFVLLHDCITPDSTVSPWAAWHALRLNFCATNTLSVTRAECDASCTQRRDTQEALLTVPDARPESFPAAMSRHTPVANWLEIDDHATPLSRIFPEAHYGFELLIGNPPYARIGAQPHAAFLCSHYDSLGDTISTRDDLYPLFVEMMWRLMRARHSAAALVVPLSIAYHTGSQFCSCRCAMMQAGGRWSFAFFDREPHALFGEDVKTRNAIIIRHESAADPERGERSRVEVGPLNKWTSRSRAAMFEAIEFTPTGDWDIQRGVPKLEGAEQAFAAAAVAKRTDRLGDLCMGMRSCSPSDALNAPSRPTVFVASTAYNFLGVFRHHRKPPRLSHPMSENPLHALEFSNEGAASRALAILSSRLVFWWWHVHCDGFHVPRQFIERLPFGPTCLKPEHVARLEVAGESLWSELQEHQFVSVNGGRATIGYRPLGCERTRDAIDETLLVALGLPARFGDELRSFVHNTVIVDRSEQRRRDLRERFGMQEATE